MKFVEDAQRKALASTASKAPKPTEAAKRTVTNTSFLLFFFFNMHLPYVFHFTYPDTSLRTRVTKHMYNMCLPHGKHTFSYCSTCV
jgi:hypothetical protein